MKKTLLSLSGALALAVLSPTEAAAQFTVWKDGVSVYTLEEGRADSVTFDYSPFVGGVVPADSTAVDLGLTSGTLWAPWNVGATKPGEAGVYFAWGETATQENYYWSTYKYKKESESDQTHDNKYTEDDGKTTLEESDDAAAVNWGGGWRMPTQAQLQELYDYCTLEWKEADWDANGSLAGYLLTSNANGKKLFLPAAGYRSGSSFIEVGETGHYWSAELNSGSSSSANLLRIDSGSWNADFSYIRSHGFEVRPVCPSAETTRAYNTPDASVGGRVPTAAEAVDLGLPSGTLWAPWNVGATRPGEAGVYFSWGETTAKDRYDMDTYKLMDMMWSESDWQLINKYTADDGKTVLEESDDAAAVNWGGKWRMPTRNQFDELFTECTWEWKDADWDAKGSLAGCLLTGPNGKQLFLPAAGNIWDSGHYNVDFEGSYWSAEVNTSYTADAFYLSVYSHKTGYNLSSRKRYHGLSVRAVRTSAE